MRLFYRGLSRNPYSSAVLPWKYGTGARVRPVRVAVTIAKTPRVEVGISVCKSGFLCLWLRGYE